MFSTSRRKLAINHVEEYFGTGREAEMSNFRPLSLVPEVFKSLAAPEYSATKLGKRKIPISNEGEKKKNPPIS